MPSGPRSSPPDLPNFQYESWLGGGGFADVFLYRQLRPAQQVAIKVLRTDGLDAQSQRSFDAEADLMARVSTHPYIVTIFGADVAPDGRPYLVMQYYPKPHYGRRSRAETLAVQEVLRVGVRIASAVETAHRAGILHRDIKPANILVNEYDRPGLTDFGIAGAREAATAAEGVTVAYAPPEVLIEEVPGDERADVYSLGATLYALLAGAAPFEARGGDNSAHALLQRTLNASIAPIPRSDVPNSLELLLNHAMAKDPAVRPSSAASLGRALQGIEQELRLAVTDFELAGAEPLTPTRDPSDADATRGRVQVVQQEDPDTRTRGAGVISGIPSAQSMPSAPSVAPPRVGSTPAPELPAAADTIGRAPRAVVPQPVDTAVDEGPRTPSRRSALAVGGAAVALVVVVVGIILLAKSGSSSDSPTTTTIIDESGLVVPDTPGVPTTVKVAVTGGSATITWTASSGQSGDTYLVYRVDGTHGDDDVGIAATATQLTIPSIAEGERPCVQVSAVRGSRESERSAPVCAS